MPSVIEDLARESTISLPEIPLWSGIQTRRVVKFKFESVVSILRMSIIIGGRLLEGIGEAAAIRVLIKSEKWNYW